MGQYTLKCHILSQLGQCYKLLGDTAYQRNTFREALEQCQRGAESSEGCVGPPSYRYHTHIPMAHAPLPRPADVPFFARRPPTPTLPPFLPTLTLTAPTAPSPPHTHRPVLSRWACYFHVRLADVYVTEGLLPEALAATQAGRAAAEAHGLAQPHLLFLLYQLQLHMLAWDQPAAEGAIAAVNAVVRADSPARHGLEAPFLAQARLHAAILDRLFALRQGNIASLNQVDGKGRLVAVLQLQGLLAAAAQQPPAYEWMHADAAAALVELLAAGICKPGGRNKEALAHLQAAEAILDGHLAAMGVGPATTEASLEFHNIWEARVFLVLKLLLLESRSQLQLTMTAYVEAGRDVLRAIALLAAFPQLLLQLQPCVHIMAGCYAHATGCYEAALAHFGAAKAGGRADRLLDAVASCLQALALLAAWRPDAVSAAVEALGEHWRELAPELGQRERAGLLFVTALVRWRQGDIVEAKHKLSSALKAAHNRLVNHELVSQVLGCMASLQLAAGDVGAAQQMVTSAITMAKTNGDLPAQVLTLRAMERVYGGAHGGDPAALLNAQEYLARKEADLALRVDGAVADPQHARILAWAV